MVAIIKISSSLRNVLQYNENKLKENVAQLIHSGNFIKDTEKLGFTDKIRTFEKLNALNERTRLKTMHISLNFDSSEKLEKETLQQIADAYMQKIGFGNQPYLVYQHHDAGHPHIHIVSTNIQRNGKRISVHNIGRNQSEKARMEIEAEFKLVKAQKQKHSTGDELKPRFVPKVNYGKTETKRAITNVLDKILPMYRYASIPELNALLRPYNIIADRGNEGSRISKNNGLVYRVLDGQGQKVGTPIKASAIYNKPTMKFLEQKFAQNNEAKQRFKFRVKNKIDLSLIRRPGQTFFELIRSLQKENIQVVLRQNEQGIIYGITFVDHETKCVHNGSDLGKQYSAKEIQERCNPRETQRQLQAVRQQQTTKQSTSQKQSNNIGSGLSAFRRVMEALAKDEYESGLASELREDEVRRIRRRLRH